MAVIRVFKKWRGKSERDILVEEYEHDIRRLQAQMAQLPKDNECMINLGYGFSLDKRHQLLPLQISNSVRNSHMICWGTTRIGKTRLAESLIEQDIIAGRSVVVFDPKGDMDLFNKIYFLAQTTNRLQDMILVTPIFPELSARIDPLSSYFMPEELIGHIISGIAGASGDDKFFFDYAIMLTSAIVHSLITLDHHSGYDQPSLNMSRVEQYVSYEGVLELKGHIDYLEQDDMTKELGRRLGDLTQQGPEYMGKVSTSLKVALAELNTGAIGKIIGKADSNRFLRRMENGQSVIMVVHLGAMLANRAAYTMGKVILSMIQSFVGRTLVGERKVVDPDLSIYIDEFHSCIYPGFANMIAMCGGANVKLHLFTQTISQLYEAVGQDATKAIIDNANTKFFMRVPDADTAEFISKHLGEHKKKDAMLSMGGGMMLRQTDDVRVKPAEIMTLGPREFFLQTYSGLYRGKTMDVRLSPKKVRFPIPTTIKKIA